MPVCRTASNGGFDITALSKAPSRAMSSTITKSSLLLEISGWAAKIVSAFFLRSYGSDHTMAMFEQFVENMCSDEAAAAPGGIVRQTKISELSHVCPNTCQENTSHICTDILLNCCSEFLLLLSS